MVAKMHGKSERVVVYENFMTRSKRQYDTGKRDKLQKRQEHALVDFSF